MNYSEYMNALAARQRLEDMGFALEGTRSGTIKMVHLKGRWKGLVDDAGFWVSTVEEAVARATGVHFGLTAENHGVSFVQKPIIKKAAAKKRSKK